MGNVIDMETDVVDLSDKFLSSQLNDWNWNHVLHYAPPPL